MRVRKCDQDVQTAVLGTCANCGAWWQPGQGEQSLPGLLNSCHLWHPSPSTTLRQRRLPLFHGVAVCTWHQGARRLAGWEEACGMIWFCGAQASVTCSHGHNLTKGKYLGTHPGSLSVLPVSSSLNWRRCFLQGQVLEIPSSAPTLFLPIVALGRAVGITSPTCHWSEMWNKDYPEKSITSL